MKFEFKFSRYIKEHYTGNKVYFDIGYINKNINKKTKISNLKKSIVKEMKRNKADRISWKGTVLCNLIDEEYKFNDVFYSIIENI